MPNHVVRNNDHISFVAVTNGYADWRTLWAENGTLRSRRSNPHMLFHGDRRVPQGDVLRISAQATREESANTDAMHSFVVPDSRIFLRLRVLDDQYRPLRNAQYDLVVDGVTKSGRTDDDGKLSEEVASSAQEGELRIAPPPPDDLQPPEGSDQPAPPTGGPKFRFPLHIGRLDPIKERAPDNWCIAGVQARLNNMGFESGPVDGIRGPITTGAVKRFQTRVNITVDGLPGQETQGKLFDLHDQPGEFPPVTEPAEGEVGSEPTGQGVSSAGAGMPHEEEELQM